MECHGPIGAKVAAALYTLNVKRKMANLKTPNNSTTRGSIESDFPSKSRGMNSM